MTNKCLVKGATEYSNHLGEDINKYINIIDLSLVLNVKVFNKIKPSHKERRIGQKKDR